MKLWSSILGVRGTYQQASPEEFGAALPESMRREIEETFYYVVEFGWAGGDPKVVHPKDVSTKSPYNLLWI